MANNIQPKITNLRPKEKGQKKKKKKKKKLIYLAEIKYPTERKEEEKKKKKKERRKKSKKKRRYEGIFRQNIIKTNRVFCSSRREKRKRKKNKWLQIEKYIECHITWYQTRDN